MAMLGKLVRKQWIATVMLPGTPKAFNWLKPVAPGQAASWVWGLYQNKAPKP
jgi:hypothetical protein